MKNLTTILIALLILIGSVNAQRVVKVAPDLPDELAKVIKADSTARRAAAPQITIYELKRNGYYPIASAIENKDFFLYIRAEAGTAPKPLLQAIPTSGTTYAYNINFRNNGKLEGLILEANQPTGGVRNRYINVYNGASVWLTSCEIMHDRGSVIAIQSDDCSLYINDCFMHSIGHPKSLGGNGRVVDLRSITRADTVIVRNSTFFNLTDRIMRNMGTTVNYVEFDHNTSLVTEGFHGGLQAGKAKVLVVTNNIFRNTIVLGAHYNRVRPLGKSVEQNQPENTNMYVLTIDTSKTFAQKVTVRNNNIYWEKKYTDLWAKYKDSTKAPGIMTATIMKALGADSTKAYYAEELKFVKEPDDIVAWTEEAIKNPNSTTMPENWWNNYQENVPADPTKTVVASFGTTAKSYTAGDKGLPVGDLNWYPDKRKLYTSVEKSPTDAIPAEFELSQNYPNPFNPMTNIRYSIPKETKVKIVVYDVLGNEVATLVNQVQQAGLYRVDFDASQLASGVYVYQMITANQALSKKMMLIK